MRALAHPSLAVALSIARLSLSVAAVGSSIGAARAETVVLVTAEGAPRPADHAGPVVATLAEAVARARTERQRTPGTVVAIELAAGTHRLAAPLVLGPEDAGSPGRRLIIRGPRDGGARVVGSARLTPVPLDPAVVALFPQAARPHVRAFALPERLRGLPLDVARKVDWQPKAMPFELHDGKGALRPARWPNAGFAAGRAQSEGGTAFEAERARVASWRQAGEIWLASFLRWDWGYATALVERVEPETGRVVLAEKPQYGFRDVPRYAVQHVAAELDEPGEWYRDPRSRHVYVWPRPEGGDIEASVSERLLVVNGGGHLDIHNLTFERAAGDAILLQGVRHVLVNRCTFRWLGGRAVVADGASASMVAASRIEDTGEGGIWLTGGDRPRLVPGENVAQDNVIVRFARLGLAARAAIQLEGVGNRATGNYIAGSVAMAIGFRGNDQLIERNEITDVVTDSSDAGAIYTGRDFTAQGTIIRHNFLRGIKGRPGFEVKGVYLDDQASGITVEGNLFLDVDQAVFLGGGRDNTVLRNVFIRSSPAIHLDGRGQTWAKPDLDDPESEINAALRAMPIQSLPWIERYPRLFGILDDHRERPKRNRAAGNLFVASTPYRFLPEVDQGEQRFDASAVARDQRDGAGVAGTSGGVASAERVAAVLREALARAGLADLPFAEMDRRERLREAGAPGDRARR